MKRTNRRQPAVLALSVLALTLIALWGFGQEPDPFAELRRQAEQGEAAAQYSLGLRYTIGVGSVPQDYQEAVKWFRMAAAQGHAGAQRNLGSSYFMGEGVPQDYQEAVKWYRMAAEQGHAEAQHSLGFAYRTGEGVPQDYQEAVKWFRMAAAQGHAGAQRSLGVMYANGQGVPQDFVQAHKWLNLAASRATARVAEGFRSLRDRLAEEMTAAQVAEAQRLAREWQPKTWEQLQDQ